VAQRKLADVALQLILAQAAIGQLQRAISPAKEEAMPGRVIKKRHIRKFDRVSLGTRHFRGLK
jgi:hypothetical protein